MDPSERTIALPLPRFGRQPIRDPELPEVATDDPTGTTPASQPATSSHLQETPPDDAPPPLPAPNPERPGRIRTSSVGDPKVGARVVAGLIALACGVAFTAFSRRGLIFRQPTREQVDDVANPLGAIIARHLPLDIVGPDLLDATAAAAAAHGYVIDGPLITRPDSPLPEDLS